MERLGGPLRARALVLVLGLTAPGCMASTLVLHVRPDGSGYARITSRVFEPAIRAFDSLFPETPPVAPTLVELLPAPSEGELQRNFGARVTLGSTSLEKAADGGVRITVVDFEDVTKLRMAFPPVFSVPVGSSFSMAGVDEAPVLTFSMKPHENGDRLLIVKLPDQRMAADSRPEITSFDSSSREELILKQAIKGLALRFFVEIEPPLLRTNAPARGASRATIFDLDLDRMINAMDEPKVRRMMSPGSLQEVLWQLGDLPGAIMPVDHEVFLEFEGPQAPPPAAAPARAAQAPPDTEIYLAPLTIANGGLTLGPPVNITGNPGYDNQPSFTPDGTAILFTSVRGGPSTAPGPSTGLRAGPSTGLRAGPSTGLRAGPSTGLRAGGTQTDIYKYDIASKQMTQVTNTPESEYSPTVTPAGAISVIRVELDEAKTQRLWQFSADGRDPRLVLEHVKPVGYHAWADDHTLALFVLGPSTGLGAGPSTGLGAGPSTGLGAGPSTGLGAGPPATLQLADTRSGTAVPVATDIGRSIQPIRGPQTAAGSISFVQRERSGDAVTLLIKELNPGTRAISVLTPAVAGATEADTAWTPDGTLLMAKGGTLYGWRRGRSGWKEVASLERLSLSGVTRLAVSPKGDYLALVGSPAQGR